MTAREWLVLFTLSLLWGGSFFFVGVAVDELPPLTLVWSRVTIAALSLWLVVLALRLPVPKSPKAWLTLMCMGVLNNLIPFSLSAWGQTQITSSLASILNATTPLFTILLAGMFLSDERLTRSKLLGVVIGLAGTVYMVGPSALSGLGKNTFAQLAVLGAAVSYGFAGVYGRKFKALNIAPLGAAAGQLTMSALLLAPLVIAIDNPLKMSMPSASTIDRVIAVAVDTSALAYTLYFRLLETAGATNIALVTFLVPVTAILLGIFALDEQLKPDHLLGMALIGIGLAVIDGRLWRRFRPVSP